MVSSVVVSTQVRHIRSTITMLERFQNIVVGHGRSQGSRIAPKPFGEDIF